MRPLQLLSCPPQISSPCWNNWAAAMHAPPPWVWSSFAIVVIVALVAAIGKAASPPLLTAGRPNLP